MYNWSNYGNHEGLMTRYISSTIEVLWSRVVIMIDSNFTPYIYIYIYTMVWKSTNGNTTHLLYRHLRNWCQLPKMEKRNLFNADKTWEYPMVVKLKFSSWGEVGTTTLTMENIVGHTIEPIPKLETLRIILWVQASFQPWLFNFNGSKLSGYTPSVPKW